MASVAQDEMVSQANDVEPDTSVRRGGRKPEDMAGQKIGRLTVLRRVFGSSTKSTSWLCLCSCGNETIVPRSSLRSGNTKSCGCLYRETRRNPKARKEFRLAPGLAAKRNLLKQYRFSAKKRGYGWDLTEEDFVALIQSPCDYCGAPPRKTRKVSKNGHIEFNGVDRIDNNMGYVSSNVVPCCHICNHAKHTMSRDEFLAWVGQVHRHSNANRRQRKLPA